jgi:hypothetical protein
MRTAILVAGCVLFRAMINSPGGSEVPRMPGTIVDRILAEYNTRKTTRDSILKRKIDGAGAPPAESSAAPPVRSPLPTSGAEHFIVRFKDELIPVIGNAVSSEVGQALSKVRSDLVDVLERQFRKLSPPARVAPTLADRLDSTETDLDLPADEVNRQLNRVFAEMEPVGEEMPFAKTVIMPTLDRFPPKEEPALGGPTTETGELTPPNTDLPPAVETEPEVVALDEPAVFPAIGQSEKDLLPWEMPAQEEPLGGTRAASVQAPAAFAVRGAEAITETLPPPGAPAEQPAAAPAAGGRRDGFAEAVLPPPGIDSNFEEDPSPIASASQFVQEIREALIPGIAAGISQVLEEIEKGQERLAKEVSGLAGRVAGLEGRQPEVPTAVLPDEPPHAREPITSPFTAPEREVTPAPPIPAALLPHPVTLSEPAVARPSLDREADVIEIREPAAPMPADLNEVILLELREMEKRLVRKIESLKARKQRKKAPSAPPAGGADNLP